MPQVAFRIGNEPFFTYTLLVYLGVLAAAGALAWEGRRRGWGPGRALEVLVSAVVPGVLGGRLTVALGLWAGDGASGSLFRQPWGDGLSFPGSLLAGALGLGVLSALWGRPSPSPSELIIIHK